ncbi:FusB/FusC family EF-G-binding protein [Paenibacillus sedimenti]|uniref:FusB/FusC family EF-G-binding protein n=1 Tax=Paenibacillus sedimenti TaxID=2770274 RepID=A0A926KTY2_9BACL|nr:FusB/FusC family EF-G-binding protein [Paenibacillus sedimenti]MBD0382836.1 FusB/FusC family EF-G-binding protein [Paenibacillus sedimenti]
MNGPFIRNHQYNFIKKQIGYLQRTCQTVSDRKVVEAVRSSTEFKIKELFPDSEGIQGELFGNIPALQTAEDFEQYHRSLESYMTNFPQVTEKQIRKLFHKNKKLPIPDLTIDYRYLTYLGWISISTGKLFLVYPLDGQIVGIEGKFTPTNKKGVCFLCNKHEELALFTAVSKSRPAHSSPDYYKAVGNYLCMDSQECNKNITDVTALERFIQDVLK